MDAPRVTPELLAVARGDAPADSLFTNCRVVNVFSGEILDGAVSVHGERIAAVFFGDQARAPGPAKQTMDLKGAHIGPGFIDAHMHVESTMLPPREFARLAAPHGTTGAVFDPHEIANVLGVPGIRALMADAEDVPLTCMFALSSCVPSCHLETSGARLEAKDLAPLFDDPRVVALAEMMNFPGVIGANPEVLEKVNLGLERRIVDGHAPGLSGGGLQAYIAAGISSDHECTTFQEARQKLRLGMQIYIREGSAARNLAALLPLVNERNKGRFCFCTDDRHPADLQKEGHIDHIVRLAVKAGLDPVTAIAMGSLHTARHYRKADMGAVAPGHFADLIVFDDVQDIRPRLVFHHGRLIARDGRFLPERTPAPPLKKRFPPSGVRLPSGLSEASFRIPVSEAAARSATSNAVLNIRVIGMDPHQLVTEHLTLSGRIASGAYIADIDRDMLKLAVIERHKGGGNIGLGFVKGFGLREGAIASTVGHDSHNLAVLGTNDGDMLAAARALAEAGGGQCAVREGKVLGLLPLPIAGLMSEHSAEAVIDQQKILLAATTALGCPHADPFMPLSFMPLPVIPRLKLSDLGLVDVEKFEIVPLEA